MRLIKYLSELRDGTLIIETLRYLTKPILSKFFFIYLIFYLYAYLGMVWFGGKVTFQIWDSQLSQDYPGFYWLMNFNDFGASLIVLFQQMVVNNWWVVVNMLSDV